MPCAMSDALAYLNWHLPFGVWIVVTAFRILHALHCVSCLAVGQRAFAPAACPSALSFHSFRHMPTACSGPERNSHCKPSDRLTSLRQCRSCIGGGHMVQRSEGASEWSTSGRHPLHEGTSRRPTVRGPAAPRAPGLLPLQFNILPQLQHSLQPFNCQTIEVQFIILAFKPSFQSS